MDCMEGMKQFPDKYFDLAIVDPPYGIGGGNIGKYFSRNSKEYDKKEWDKSTPNKCYFNSLFRISNNQIICGGNYFELPISKGWIVWDKNNGENDMPDCELLWTSFNKKIKKYTLHHFNSNYDKNRIHPTQKPSDLYRWILRNYAKPDFKIIDTHVGSGSSIIAFLDFGCEWIGFEIDEDYHKAASERIEIHKKRPKPFFTDVELADKNIKQKGFF